MEWNTQSNEHGQLSSRPWPDIKVDLADENFGTYLRQNKTHFKCTSMSLESMTMGLWVSIESIPNILWLAVIIYLDIIIAIIVMKEVPYKNHAWIIVISNHYNDVINLGHEDYKFKAYLSTKCRFQVNRLNACTYKQENGIKAILIPVVGNAAETWLGQIAHVLIHYTNLLFKEKERTVELRSGWK